MKLSTSLTLTIFTLLLLLYIPSSLCTFLSDTDLPIDYDEVRNQLDFSTQVYESDNSDNQNYYQLAAFLNFLSSYNFTNAYLDTDSSDDTDQTSDYNGIIYHNCYPNPSAANQPMGIYCSLALSSLSGQTVMAQQLIFDLNGAEDYQLNSPNSELVFFGIPTNVTTENGIGPTVNQSCVGNLTYSFVNAETYAPFNYAYDQMGDLVIQISYQGQNCSEQVVTSFLGTDQYSDEMDRVLPYVYSMIGMAIVQLLSCAKVMKSFERSASDAVNRRISVGGITFFMTFGFYIFLLHFEYWMVMPDLMLGIVILFFMISLCFEPSILFFIFRSIKRSNDTTQIISTFYRLCFWLLFASTSVILSFTFVPDCLLYAYPFFLLPQIIDNFLSRRKQKWNLWLLLGVGLPNLLYVIYRGIDPLQLFIAEPDYNIVISASVVFAIELILLQIQTKKPTFGIKLSGGHNYTDLGTMEEKETAIADVCSICMEKLDQKPLNGSCSESLLEQTHKGEEILRTPCKHYYHGSCLQEWVKKKLECPNCRQGIPELIEDD